ncbi:MAG: hypothetical protein KA123_01295 [Candidatus Eisenbacteria bacterium]|nr:hypothetical protein [Candidatus Eisenbacteria bacterium]
MSLRATTGIRPALGHSKTVGYLLYEDVGVQTPYFEEEDTETVWDMGAVLSLDLQEQWGRRPGDLLHGPARTHAGRGNRVHPLRKASLDEWYGMIGMNILLRYDFS